MRNHGWLKIQHRIASTCFPMQAFDTSDKLKALAVRLFLFIPGKDALAA